MRQSFAWLTTMAAVAASWSCVPGRTLADEHGRREVEHRGSIRYVAPEVHRDIHERDIHIDRGSIHFEHHEGPGWRGPVHVRYDRDYFARFRPGYGSLLIGPDTFYYYPALPPGCQSVVVNGQAYYFSNGVYYMPYLYGATTVFVVVPPPVP